MTPQRKTKSLLLRPRMYNGTKEANGLPYLISDLVVHLNDRKDVDDEAVHKVMKGIGKKNKGKKD